MSATGGDEAPLQDGDAPATTDVAPADEPPPEPTAAAAPSPSEPPVPSRGPRPWPFDPGLAAALLALLAFGLFVRVWTTPGIEVGGDAVRAWFNAKQLTLDLIDTHWAWDHHSVRFAIILPTWLVQEVVGMDPRAYFVLPYGLSLLTMALLFRIGVRAGHTAAGFVAAVAFAVAPPMARFGSQLLGEVFSAAFSVLGVWLLLRYQDRERSRAWTAGLLAGAMFLAYETKITNVLFVPGFAVALWVLGRRLRDVAIFGGGLFAMFCLETIAYRTLTEHRLGQLSIIGGSHLKDRRLRPTELSDFFTHVLDLSTFWQVTLLALAASFVAGWALHRRTGRLLPLVALVPLSFLLLQNFAVKGIDPLVPVQRFLPRYLTPALPLAMLAVAWLGASLLSPLTSRLRAAWVRPLIAAGMLALGIGWVVARGQPEPRQSEHPLSLLAGYERLGNDLFAKGVPVTSTLSPKTVDFFLKVLWRGLRSEAKVEKLPKIRKVGSGRRATWFALSPKVERIVGRKKNAAILEEWAGKEVATTDTIKHRSMEVSPSFVLRKAKLRIVK